MAKQTKKTTPPDKAEQLLKLAEQAFPKSLFTAAEVLMLQVAAKGKCADCKFGGDADPANADKWDKKRTIRAGLLRWLCIDAEAQKLVGPKGINIEAARIDGRIDLGFANVPFPLGLWHCAVPDGIDLIQAETRGLYFSFSHIGHASGENKDDFVSIRADGLTVRGDLFLRCAVVYGEVKLPSAKIKGALTCSGGKFENKGAKVLNADSAEIGGNVFLDEGFRATGEVRLPGARIKGQLACAGGRFFNPDGCALRADGTGISDSVFLNKNFHATGEVRLLGAKIKGSLECRGGQFENKGAKALSADGVEIGGSVLLDGGFHATGEVRLLGAGIKGQLNCGGGRFENKIEKEPKALSADRAEIGGSVFLNKNFHATGEVWLPGAKIAGNLECRGGRFENNGAKALVADGAEITGVLFLDGNFRIEGQLRLVHAKAGVLKDSKDCWPKPGNLLIDGFEYGAIVSGSPTDAKTRKKWLRRQYPALPIRRPVLRTLRNVLPIAWRLARRHGKKFRWKRWGVFLSAVGNGISRAFDPRRSLFRPQPYEQLARALRLAGHEGEAKKILMAKEDDRYKYSKMGLFASLRNRLSKVILGYGYRVWRIWIGVAFFVVAGWIIFGLADAKGGMVPAKEGVYMASESYKSTRTPPDEYPQFNCFFYSLDCFVPLVNLHQEEYWQPVGENPFVQVARIYLWVHISCGWILTTLGLVGITGLVRKELPAK